MMPLAIGNHNVAAEVLTALILRSDTLRRVLKLEMPTPTAFVDSVADNGLAAAIIDLPIGLQPEGNGPRRTAANAIKVLNLGVGRAVKVQG